MIDSSWVVSGSMKWFIPPSRATGSRRQAATHELFFYAPNLTTSNANTDYFRVTSLFTDPSLYGRHVVLGFAVLLVLLWAGKIGVALAAPLMVLLFAGLYFSYSQSSFVALFAAVLLVGLVAGDRRARLVLATTAAAVILRQLDRLVDRRVIRHSGKKRELIRAQPQKIPHCRLEGAVDQGVDYVVDGATHPDRAVGQRGGKVAVAPLELEADSHGGKRVLDRVMAGNGERQRPQCGRADITAALMTLDGASRSKALEPNIFRGEDRRLRSWRGPVRGQWPMCGAATSGYASIRRL